MKAYQFSIEPFLYACMEFIWLSYRNVFLIRDPVGKTIGHVCSIRDTFLLVLWVATSHQNRASQLVWLVWCKKNYECNHELPKHNLKAFNTISKPFEPNDFSFILSWGKMNIFPSFQNIVSILIWGFRIQFNIKLTKTFVTIVLINSNV